MLLWRTPAGSERDTLPLIEEASRDQLGADVPEEPYMSREPDVKYLKGALQGKSVSPRALAPHQQHPETHQQHQSRALVRRRARRHPGSHVAPSCPPCWSRAGDLDPVGRICRDRGRVVVIRVPWRSLQVNRDTPTRSQVSDEELTSPTRRILPMSILQVEW
ncbi:hypothetical protein EYF80_052867 [Liparis tanakae]|uniref:Uncharacterized protein n=1 Tax=Liparis tanakae TaxID=230148 RepID=A0A4Z2F7W4_9TELE|nr:hypothetical protein EYF80_052867 [Liparis tanakae]